MIKISANISKKVPIPGTEFSSQQYGASMEIEVSDADQPDVIQNRIRDLYGLVTQAVDGQIAAATQASSGNSVGSVGNRHETAAQPARQSLAPAPTPMPASTGRASYRDGGNGSRANGNGANAGNGRKTGATEAQCRAIYAICKNLNLDMTAVLADLNVTEAGQLSVKDASRLIDDLKNRQNGAAAQQPRR